MSRESYECIQPSYLFLSNIHTSVFAFFTSILPARRCGDPGDIQNGHREGNVFIFPNRVTYICSEGYELVGRSYRVCQENGQWSGQVPNCKRK